MITSALTIDISSIYWNSWLKNGFDKAHPYLLLKSL